MNAKLLLTLLPLIATPLCAQSGSKIINDDKTELVVGSDNGTSRNASITINIDSKDTSCIVTERDQDGKHVRDWELDGVGDGTGSILLPAGHSLEVEDPDDTDSHDVKIDYDVTED